MHVQLSIITVNLNNSNGLLKTIKSIIDQSFTSYEYIVIDGGSTDGSKEIIEKYSDKITYWVSEPDKGIYDGMNKGIRAAKGNWLYFINSGDILKYNVISNVFESNIAQFDFIYGNAHYSKSNRIYDGEFSIHKILVKNICHQAIFIKRTVMEELGFFDTKYPVLADYAINIKIFTGPFAYKYLDLVFAEFEEGGVSGRVLDVAFLMNFKQNYIIPFSSFIKKDNIIRALFQDYHRILKSNQATLKQKIIYAFNFSVYTQSVGSTFLIFKKLIRGR